MKPSSDIFISFKKTENDVITADAVIARALYERLLKEGYNPFFSDESIAAAGYSNYADAIDSALNTAKILIYIALKPEYLETTYVKYEWSSFSNELKTGNKQHGHILGFIQGVRMAELPYALRSYEAYQVSDIETFIARIKQLFPLKSSENEVINFPGIAARQFEKYSEYLVEDIYPRKTFNQFFEFIITNKTNIAVITYEKNISGSAIITQEAHKWFANNNNILFLESEQDYQLLATLDFNEDEHYHIIFHKVDRESKTKVILNLLELRLTNLSVISTFAADFVNLSAKIQNDYEETNYHLDVLSESEALEFIQQQAKEIGLPLAGNLETILVMPTLKELRRTFVLKLVLTSIKKMEGYTDQDYNITDIFEIIEHSLIREYITIGSVIEKIFQIILKKKINIITPQEIAAESKEMEILATKALVRQTNNGYIISNKEYYFYRLALTLFNSRGLGVSAEDFLMISDAKPYYCYITYLETKVIVNDIINTLNIEQAELFLSLMISERAPFSALFANEHFHIPAYNLLTRFRHSGLYNLAGLIIKAFENNKIESTNEVDYFSEKLLLHYFQTGESLVVENSLWRSKYHQAYIYFCTDNYNESEQLYEEALALMKAQNIYNVSLLFDYMELALDFGNKAKVKEILALSQQHCNHDDSEYIIRFNLLEGDIRQDELAFSLAEDHYKIALKKALEHFNLKKIQIAYGSLGRLLIYLARYDEAQFYLTKNLEIAQALSDFNGIAISAKLLAIIEMLTKNYTDAYKYFGYALMYANQVKNYWRIYKLELYLDLLDSKRAKNYAHDIKNVFTLNSDNFLCSALPLVMLLMLKQGVDVEKIRSYFLMAVNAAERTTDLVNGAIINTIASSLGLTSAAIPVVMQKYASDIFAVITDLKAQQNVDFTVQLPNYLFNELKSPRLALKIVHVNYVEDIYEYTANESNTMFVKWPRHRDYKDTFAFIKDSYKLDFAGLLYRWIICLPDKNKAIGTIDLTYSESLNAIELGYIVNQKYWRHGYATEATKLVLDFAERILDIEEIVAVAIAENMASRRVLEKTNFQFVKIIENYCNLRSSESKTGALYRYVLKKKSPAI